MAKFYLPLILWALHQALGTQKGDAVYAQLSPLIVEQLHPTAATGPENL